MRIAQCFSFFFFNDTATTEIYTLSLHDALPISAAVAPWSVLVGVVLGAGVGILAGVYPASRAARLDPRSEEHTSELQSQSNLVCRLLLEKKKRERGPLHLRITNSPYGWRRSP